MAGASVLLVIERILEPPNQGPGTKLGDLNMMVNPGGRERAEAEFAALFEDSSFALQRVHPTDCPYFLIEAKPV